MYLLDYKVVYYPETDEYSPRVYEYHDGVLLIEKWCGIKSTQEAAVQTCREYIADLWLFMAIERIQESGA